MKRFLTLIGQPPRSRRRRLRTRRTEDQAGALSIPAEHLHALDRPASRAFSDRPSARHSRRIGLASTRRLVPSGCRRRRPARGQTVEDVQRPCTSAESQHSLRT